MGSKRTAHLRHSAMGPLPTDSLPTFLPSSAPKLDFKNTETTTELAERTKTFFQSVSLCNTHPHQAFQQPIDVSSQCLIGTE